MHLFLDLDGTLTDSRPGIIGSIRMALAAHDLPVPAPDELLWCIGPPILESLAKLVGPARPELFEPTVATYRQHYSATGLLENAVYPGIMETLGELRAAGHTLHVATSKAEIYAVRIVGHFGLAPHFHSVNGSGLDGSLARKADLISHIMEREGLTADRVMMIGDREHDVHGARAHGVPAIGVLWGYGTGGELMRAGAAACVRVPQLLPETVAALAAR